MSAVKICGVCSAADAALVASFGADYIGVILAPGRARSRSETDAAAIYAAAAGVRRVGVFVDATASEVGRVADRLQLDVVQLHGDEGAHDVAAAKRAGRVVWKAVRVQTREDVERAIAAYDDVADALLLDGWSAHGAGGTGTRFDWSEIAPLRTQWPASLGLVAAGGLRADNVAAAIAALQPDVVDVSSGVESSVCVKSAHELTRFIAAARAAVAGKAGG